ncbi:MAG: 50S ribosomal protein L4 [Acidobacteria bacterium]|nr:50S ribosomal protein L4 [Acidobacteriota bacterium]
MPSIEVKNLANQTVGSMELADEIFAAPVNQDLLYEAVRHFLACRRAGTHATKNRAQVSGSGRKLWRQKGTGRARIGSIRSPLWRHGGTVFGPQPRSYAYRLPRKMVLGALRSALSAKLADQQLTVVDEFRLENHKTKALRQILDRFDAAKNSILLVDLPGNRNLELSSANLEKVQLISAREVHPYHLLRCHHLLISRPAAERLQEALAR